MPRLLPRAPRPSRRARRLALAVSGDRGAGGHRRAGLPVGVRRVHRQHAHLHADLEHRPDDGEIAVDLPDPGRLRRQRRLGGELRRVPAELDGLPRHARRLPTSYAAGVGSWTTAGDPAGETTTYQITYTLAASSPVSAQGGTAAVAFTWEAQNT